MLRRVVVTVSTVVGAALVFGSVPAIAAPGLTIKGSIANPTPAMRVLAVASDGTALYADVNPTTGKYSLRVTNKKLLKSFSPGKGKKKTGTSLQLVTDGIYSGPFLLGKKGKKGYGRLTPTAKGTVNIGKATLTSTGFVKLAKALKVKLRDANHPMKLKSGVPIGAGTFGGTGKITKSNLRSRFAIETIPNAVSGSGDDADQDGVVNVADVDMNGDGVLDAAQMSEAPTLVSGEALTQDAVLENRPLHQPKVAKILTSSPENTSNSYAFPSVSWSSLTASWAQDLVIELSVIDEALRGIFCPGQSADEPLCAAAAAVTTITVDCRQLEYCSPTSDTKLVGPPSSNLDGKPISAALNADGLIELPRYDENGATSFRLSLRPGLKEQALFVGDAYVFNFLDANGAVLGSQAKVLTSSVATPLAFKQLGSTDISYPLTSSSSKPLTFSAAALNALEVTLYRPQQLDPTAAQATPTFIDRGGLNYMVTLMTENGPNSAAYGCKSQYYTPTSTSTRVIADPNQPTVVSVYDDDLMPENGTTLSFTVNVNGCLTDPMSVGPPGPLPPAPAPGTPLRFEIGAQDADDNKTDAKVYLTAP